MREVVFLSSLYGAVILWAVSAAAGSAALWLAGAVVAFVAIYVATNMVDVSAEEEENEW